MSKPEDKKYYLTPNPSPKKWRGAFGLIINKPEFIIYE
jgi:hypothetical protein